MGQAALSSLPPLTLPQAEDKKLRPGLIVTDQVSGTIFFTHCCIRILCQANESDFLPEAFFLLSLPLFMLVLVKRMAKHGCGQEWQCANGKPRP